MIDIEKVVRDYLITVSALMTLTGGRIYASTHLPPSYKPDDGPALLFALRGGGQDYSSHVLVASLQFRSYALTATLARQLDRELYSALNDVKTGQIKYARLETPGQLLTEPETGWYFALSFYRVLVGNP